MRSELEQEFFRVWDKNQNKMFIPQDNINYCKVGGYVVSIEIYQNMSGSIKPVIRPSAIYDNAISMQCTGRKDKNGKLIYKGDIVKGIDHFNRNRLCYITYSNNYACFFICGDKWSDEYLFNLTDVEVIGNIYENSKLLED